MELALPEKLEFLLEHWRIKVAWGGRAGAKSWGAASALLTLGIQRPLRILCAREIQKSIKESVHQLMQDRIEQLGYGPLYRTLETEIKGTVQDTTIMYTGLQAHTVDSIKSYEAVDIVWVEEGQSISDHSWKILIPTIRKPGSEIWVTMNPKLKSDPAWVRFVATPRSDAKVVHITYKDNPWLSEESKRDIEHDRINMDPEEFANIWDGLPKGTVEGAIYGAQLRTMRRLGRIGNVPPKPRLALNSFMDLGTSVGNATAYWLHQQDGTQHRFVKYGADHGKGMAHWWDEMDRWRREKGLRWGKIYLPHDGRAKMQGAELSDRKEILERLAANDGVEVEVVAVPRTTNVDAAIDLTREKMADAYIDETECKDGLLALESYQYLWDDAAQVFKRQPLHNWASNGADAFRQWAQGYEGELVMQGDEPVFARRSAEYVRGAY